MDEINHNHKTFIPASGGDEFYTDERCYISELLNDHSHPAHSIARARVEPGVTTVWHRVKPIEIYIIEKGVGRADIGNEQFNVGPGDSIVIPPMVRQRITNTGDQDLIFLCLCSPRFTPATYESLE